MADLLTIAKLAKGVYSEESAYGVPPYKCQWWIPTDNKSKGFQGGIYHDEDQVVVAFKGTEITSWRDITADLRIFLKDAPNQAKIAYELTVAAISISEGRRILITGHSLGGGLAQVVGYWTDLPFCTFNAPPMGASSILVSNPGTTNSKSYNKSAGDIARWLAATGDADTTNVKGVNWRVKRDPVSSSVLMGGHVGPVRTLKRSGSFFKAHFMSTVLASIASDEKLSGR